MSTHGTGGEAAAELPPVLQRLWDPATRPRRGPKPALSLARITQAALEIADAEGLAAVSMGRVGESLGYTGMALYRYVGSKDEMLVLMADAAGKMPPGLVPDPRAEAVDWRTGLEQWTRAQIELIVARPWYLELPLTTVLPGPNRVMWLERGFELLQPTGLSTEEKFAVLGMLAEHVLGEARVQVETHRASLAGARRAAGLPEDATEDQLDPDAIAAADPYAGLEEMLALFVDPQRHPALHRAVHEERTTEHDPRLDDIGFAISVVLDGVETFVEHRRAERARRARSVTAPSPRPLPRGKTQADQGHID